MREHSRLLASLAIAALALTSVAPDAGAATDPLRRLQYWLDRVHAPLAWTRARGAGVAIAIVDTGVDLFHEDLRSHVIPGHDFVSNDDLAQDENGHGTHVAGIAAAATDNGVGVAGVAPDASIMPLRVLDARGTGNETNVASAIDWAVGQSDTLGLRLVINLSLTDVNVTGRVSSRRIQDAVRRAWFAGAVVVAAVGNEALPFGDYPAAGPNILAVGATDEGDGRASFSNRDALVVAPGEKIVSTYWDPSKPSDHNAYASGSGTSMAAPIVSGVAALLLSSGLTNRQTVDRIVQTADDFGPPGRDPDFGYGRVDAARALGLPVPGAPVAPAAGLPAAAGGKFEEIGASPLPRHASAPPGRAGPDKALAIAAAVLVSVLAYAGTRLRAGVRARRAPPPDPWET